MSRNPITGDKIATKPSKAYEEGYDAIFRKDAEVRVIESERCPMCDVVVIDEAPITQA